MNLISDENLQLVTGQIVVGQGVLVAYDLGFFKLLNDKTLSIHDIAKHLKISTRSVQALISCCCTMDLVVSEDGKTYGLSLSGKTFLTPEVKTFYGGVFDLLIKQVKIMDFEVIKKSILTNAPQIDDQSDLFSSEGLGSTVEFVRATHQKAVAPAFYWTNVLKLDGYNRFIDIGGGSGVHTIAACLNNPSLAGILCDRQPVINCAKDYVREFNLCDRVVLKELDMWNHPFPEGDIYFFGDIFHDWSKENCALLARECFCRLPKNGLIILHEMLFNTHKTGPLLSAAYNMKMMLWTKGQQFSFLELKEILQAEGFRDIKSFKGLGNWSIIIGKK